MSVAIPGSNPPSGRGHHHEVPGYPKRELYQHDREVVQCTCGEFFQLRYSHTDSRGKHYAWSRVPRWKRKLRREAEARITAERQYRHDTWGGWADV